MTLAIASRRLLITPTPRPSVRGEAWPPVSADGVTAAIALDFETGRYWWGGQARAFSDLTVLAGAPAISGGGYTPASGDRLTLPAAAFAEIDPFAGTFEVEHDQVGTPVSGQILFALHGSSGSTRSRFELYADSAGNIKLYHSYHNGSSLVTVGDLLAVAVIDTGGYAFTTTRRRKAVARYADGQFSRLASGTAGQSSTTAFGVAPAGSRWSASAIGYRAWDNSQYALATSLKRLVYWPAALSDAALLARAKISTKTNLHMLGDSFSTSTLCGSVRDSLTPDFRSFRVDGVGGSTLSAQATRWAATPQYYDHTLILMDGSGPDEDMTTVYLPKLAEIVGRLTSGKWLYIEGGLNRLWTPAAVAAQRALYAQVQAAYPGNFVSTYDYMRANGTGTTTGANGGAVWPANCYGDDLHPSTEGNTVLGACIAAALAARGW